MFPLIHHSWWPYASTLFHNFLKSRLKPVEISGIRWKGVEIELYQRTAAVLGARDQPQHMACNRLADRFCDFHPRSILHSWPYASTLFHNFFKKQVETG